MTPQQIASLVAIPFILVGVAMATITILHQITLYFIL